MLKCRRIPKYFEAKHPFVHYLLMKQCYDENSATAENSGVENDQCEFQTLFMGRVKTFEEIKTFKVDENDEIIEI